ncbi:hypothetical protein V6R21_27345 [Limibacter armeniacum]|uniref:hypothetical protein n=1 Tax=Limibacter armeniacum TaxID=466084 RepID=UPI002FE5186F
MATTPVRNLFFSSLLLQTATIIGITVYSTWKSPTQTYRNERALSERFLLTDFCFSTESRHTRHISMPEIMAPFQDLPGFHDHFPSSSFFHPPANQNLNQQ